MKRLLASLALCRTLLGAYLWRCGLVNTLKASFLQVPTSNGLYNPVTNDYDIQQGNVDNISAVPALAAAGVGASGVDQVNINGAGVQVVVDITAISGAGATLTLIVEGKDPVSGKYFPLLTSAGLTAISTTVLTVYPGIAVTANVTASTIVPRSWRVRYTITGTTPSVTATIGACVMR
jgi:hypothetical protein